ncbi:hypothetical protein [Agrobacterium sp. lyk4-40-TYG-31]|uniref:hypothetical protein n=1 Tax=Agrobacterium sp. lyk4-40-TYG-31 TaxID=3040276 RepID=UPI002551C6D4|nr:hypothetical protein [Agrobacterium sp. lyk4-40-TYG-31]
MTSTIDDDLSLYRAWPHSRVYAPLITLETKSLPHAIATGTIHGPDGLWGLLNEMTAEMREQFRFFRQLREGAGAALEGVADEAAGKVARADVKAANDAVSLIVRTLEKIDTLQRQLARDREAAAEDAAGAQDYEEAVAFFQRRIDELVRQKVRARLVAAGVSPDEDAVQA